MKVEISNSSVGLMLDFLKKLKYNKAKKEELHKILTHEDYKFEFERYNSPNLPICNITQEEFEAYLMNCLNTTVEEVNNPRLKIKHNILVDFIKNIENYSVDENFLQITDEDIEKIQENLKNAFFPEHLENLKKIKVIVTISIGNSFGWPHKDCIHFDFIQLFKFIKTKEELIALASHEIHHIVFGEMLQKLSENASPLLYYLLNFSYEGLAEKFNNNAKGIYSRPLYNDRPINMVVDELTWNAFAREFPFMLERFIEEIKVIREKNLTHDDVLKLLTDYWITPNIVLATQETINPLHYRSYFFGNEMFGSIYDKYGLEKMFSMLSDPEKIINEFLTIVNK